MPGSGRRRQAATPWRKRVRFDLFLWGLLAGAAAAAALGLTGGGWGRALVLGLLVVGACALLTLLASGSSRGKRSGPRPPGDSDRRDDSPRP